MRWLRIIAAAVACLLTSCMDGHEEIWIEANGSGHLEIRYELPASVAKLKGGEAGVRAIIKKFLSVTPQLKSPSQQVVIENDRLKIHVRASFDSALDLKEISSGPSLGSLPPAAEGIAGKVELKFVRRAIDFTRTISAGNALPGSLFMASSKFDGHRITYVFHLPVPPFESNATRTADAGRTLIWDFPLADAVRSPVTTHFKMNVPIPPWIFAMLLLVPAIVIVGWIIYRRKRSLRGC